MKTNPPSDKRLVRFVFRELYLNRELVHFERDQGSHDGDRLAIGKMEIPDRDIRYVNRVDDQLHIGWDDVDLGPRVVSMIIDADLAPVVAAVHYGLSRREFDQQLEHAASEGMGTRCRDAVCQHCSARILSVEDYPWAPQIYCKWCDSLNTTIDVAELGNLERDYRICPGCSMYSRPRKFTIAYFWFLIFHADVSHKVVHCCNDCMRPQAWKMVFGNLFGLLGMPLAMTQLVRVYRDSIKGGPFRDLDHANRLLKRGRVDRALDKYWKIVERHPVSSGVLYNVALGLLAQGDRSHARETLELALANCANYQPAQRLMASQFGEADIRDEG